MLIFILNILWFIFGGFLAGLGWVLAGVIMAVTIIGIPWARSCFMLARYTFWPFGYDIVSREQLYGEHDIGTGLLGTIGNVIWFVFAGWWLALMHISAAIALTITIIGTGDPPHLITELAAQTGNTTDLDIAFGTVTFTTNLPTVADPCSGGGISWLYALDWKTGGSALGAEKTVSGDLITAKFLAGEFATRPVVVQLPNGKIVTITQLNVGDVIVKNAANQDEVANNTLPSEKAPIPDRVQGHRAGWREIIPER